MLKMGTNASVFTVSKREVARTSDRHTMLSTGLSKVSVPIKRFGILVVGLVSVSGREGSRNVGSRGDQGSI